MTTPAQKAGLIIGSQYRVKQTSDREEFRGKVVTFDEDDGSMIPHFKVEGDARKRFLYVDTIEPLSSESGDLSYKIDVQKGSTTIIVGKALSLDQIKRIMDILGE